MPQPPLHRHPASRPSGGRRVIVVLGGLLAVAMVLTAATYRPASDPGSRVQSGVAPAQAATAPAAQASRAAVQTADAAVRTTAPRRAAASADVPMPAGSAGQHAFIDPVTKRIREAEHDDAAALAPKAAPQRRTLRTAGALAEPEPVFGPDGMVGMAVPEELSTFVVATRTPDGGVVLEHATGPKAAQAKTRAAKARTTEKKGEPNDR
jgi:hypothetical protein